MAEWYWARERRQLSLQESPLGSYVGHVLPGVTTFTLIDCGEKEFYIVSLMYAKVQRLLR